MTNDTRFDRLLAEGLASSREGRSAQAVRLFEEAAALAPGSGVPHFLVGSEHASRGDIPAAELAFANAVLLAPQFVLARYQLGLLQFSSQRAALALLTWQPLLGLPAGQPLPHFVRGFAALAHDQYDEALAHYQAGLGCANDNPPLFADIEQVVQAVERLLAGTSAPPDSEARAGHVLLSGYGGNLH